MASLGKSNFSKLMAMLLSVIMVLSTMAFTLPVKVKAESKVLWEENFDFELGEGEEYYDISTLHPDWVATIADHDGDDAGTFYARATDANISWSDAATVHGPRIAFDGEKVVLTKARNTWDGNSKVDFTMPMTFNTDDGKHPTTGYTVFEYDYYSDALFVKNGANEWGSQDVILYNDASQRDYARLSVTSENGIQDLLDTPIVADGSTYRSSRWLSSYYSSMIANTHKENIRTASDLQGKTVKMQIVYDLENMKYMVSATVDGEKKFRGNTWMDIPDTVYGYNSLEPSVDWFIDRVKLQAAEVYVGTGDSVASYDNMKYTHYTVLPEFLSSSVEEGDTGVPVSGTIDLTFSEDIDEASIDGISLKAGNTEADVTVAMNGTDRVTVTYEGLSGNVDYTLTVPETVTNLGGLPISAKQEITFTTEETVPAVTSVTPADNSSNQLLTVAPEVTFSEAVDEETIDGITLSDTYGNVAVTRALSADGKTVTLTPDYSLDAGITYTVTVPETVKSLGGIAVARTTSTFTTSTGGTVLWSENFDTITAENVMTERSNWTASIVDSTSGSFNSSSESWAAAATDYKSKLVFDNGKLVLGQIRNTENGGHYVSFTMPMIGATHPSSGYAVLEYDYYSDAVPIRNRYNERSGLNDVRLYQTNGSGRVYGTIDITSTNGIQDMLGAGSINATTYPTVAAGTHKNNIRTAEDIQGKDVHMVVIFDIANTQYNIGAKVDGKYSFRSTDWVDLPSSILSTEFRYLGMTLKQNECNTGSSVWSEATYDNFTYTHYTTLPAFVSHNIADTADVPVTGSFDLTFDTAIDEASLNQISLKAYGAETAEEIELSMKDSKTVTVSYSKLSPSTPYTLTLPRTVVSNLGLPISNPQDISFTTNEFAAPELASSTVENNEAGVALNKVLQLTFSAALAPETVENITLKKADDNTNYVTDYILSDNNTVVTLYHNLLASNTQYTLNVPATVTGVTGIPVTANITFTTGTYNADGSVWSQDFDAIDALSGEELNAYMANLGWTSAQIGTAWAKGEKVDYHYGSYKSTNFTLSSGAFTWSEAANKYLDMPVYPSDDTSGTPLTGEGGCIDFANGRIKLGVSSRMAVGSTETNVVIPVRGVDVTEKDYAVFEFDYYTDKMTGRLANNVNFATGDIMLRNTAGNNIAKINISTTTGLSDIADLATVNADTLADAVDNIGPDDNLTGKIVHFKVIFDIEKYKYKISATPEGGATMARDDGAWISLPANVTVGGFENITLSLKDYLNGAGVSYAEYDNFKITTVEGNPAVIKSSLDDVPDPIPVTRELKLYFTEAMDEDSLSEITLTPAVGEVVTLVPELSNDGKVATLNHAALNTNTTYTLTVPVSVTSALGIPMAEEVPYQFTTDSNAAPEVISSTVADDTGVSVNKVLQLTFSAELDPETVENITLKKTDDNTNYVTDYILSDNNTVVTLYHNVLAPNTQYTINVPATVKSSAGIPATDSITFTTGAYNADGSAWSQDFEGMRGLSGEVLDDHMANLGWTSAQIGTSWKARTAGDGYYYIKSNAMNFALNNATTGFKWSEAPIKYRGMEVFTSDTSSDKVTGYYAGSIDVANGRIKLGVPSAQENGGTETFVKIPVSGVDVEGKDYAVFEFDYYTEKMSKRPSSNYFGRGDIILTNATNASTYLARINIGTTSGISDILELTTFDATTLGNAANNIGPTTGLTGKTIQFRVIFDIAEKKYKISATPEGGATMTRTVNDSEWIALPSGVTVNGFSQIYLSLIDYLNGSATEQTFAEYDNFKITTVEGNPEVIKSSLDGVTETSVTEKFVLYFTEAIDEDTLESITLETTLGGEKVTLTPQLSNGGKVVTLKHAALAINTPYTLTVPVDVTSALGIPLKAAKPYNFTTDDVEALYVADSTVEDDDKGIAPNKVIAITLSEAFAGNTERNITLKAKDSDEEMITDWQLSEDGTVVTLVHKPFAKNTSYVLTIPDTVIGVSGMNVVETVIDFTSYDSDVTATINVEATDVPLDAKLELTFDKVINNTNIGSITLTPSEGVTITPALDGTGKVVSLTNSTLKPNTTYTVTIPAGLATDDGIPVTAKTFEFSTIEVDAPEITVSVNENEQYVLLDREIIITSTEALKEATLADITLTKKSDSNNLISNWVLSDEGKTIKLVHDGFEVNTEYVLTIPSTVVGNLSGLPVTETVINFKTYESLITSSLNASGDGVAVSTKLQLTFDKAITDENIDTIELWAGASKVDIDPSLDDSDTVVLLNNERLDYETLYTVIIPQGLKDANGVPVEEKTFTFNTKVLNPIIWQEDFTTLPEGVTADTSLSGWNTDGWSASIEDNGYEKDVNEFKFVGGKLQMTKGQTEATAGKGLVAVKTIEDAPTSGIVTFDYDFTVYGAYADDAYFPAMALMNEAGQQLLALNIGSEAAGICVNNIAGSGNVYMGTESAGAAVVSARTFGHTNSNKPRYTAMTSGNTINVRVLIDLDDKVYSVVLKNGSTEYRTSTAYFDIDPDITDLRIAKVAFQADNATTNYTDTPVISTVDNILLRVAVPGDAPAVVGTEIANEPDYISVVKDIEIKFSQEMKKSTLANVKLVKTDDQTGVALSLKSLAADCKTATFSHARLEYDTQYTLTIPVTVKSATGVPFEDVVTYTFTTHEDPGEGTLLWSENFDNITNDNVGESHYNWSATATIINPSNVNATVTKSTTGGTLSWAEADDTYSSRIAFTEDGKLALSEQRNTVHGGAMAQIVIPFTYNQAHPTTGYTILEYDYYSESMPVRNRYNEVDQYYDLKLDQKNGSNRTYGLINVSSTNGIQSMFNVGRVNSDELYNSFAQGTYKDNVRHAEDLDGKTVHMVLIFDVANTQYNVAALVDGEYSFLSEDWVDYTSNQHPEQFFDRITLTQKESPLGSDEFTTVTYDNFKYTHYTADKLPAFVSATLGENAQDVACTGEIDVTFSKPIDPASIGSIRLEKVEAEAENNSPVDIDVVMKDEDTVTVKYSRLLGETDYVLTIPKIVTDKNGLMLANQKVINFKTTMPVTSSNTYNLKVSINGDTYNAGETVTADIMATGNDGFNSYEFTLDYDKTALQLTGVTTELPVDNIFEPNLENGTVAFVATVDDITLDEESETKIATATFKVLDDAKGSQKIELKDPEMTPSGVQYNETAPTTESANITVYSIKVNFAAGEGVTLSEGATTAYAKYNESGLYTDTTYTEEYTIPTATAGDGYQLKDANKYWYNGAAYFTADAIKTQVYNASVTYTATAIKKFTVTVNAGAQGTFAQDATTSFDVDGGTKLGELGLPELTVNTGYVFTGWKVGDTEEIITPEQVADYEVTENLALTAQYANGEYDFTVTPFDNGEIAELSGVTNEDKATFGTPVTFQVTTDADCVVKTVAYTVSGTPTTLQPDESGTYTIPGSEITADVTVEVVVLKYHTVTFTAGEGTTVSEMTAYVVSGSAGMYTTLDLLKAQGEPDFVIPTPAPQSGYRLAADTAEEPLWTDGVNVVMTSEFEQKSFTDDVIYEAVAVQQFTVTFTIRGNGQFAPEAVTTVKVDAGKKVTAIPELVLDTGFELKEWQSEEVAVTPTEVEITEDTEFVAIIELGKHAVTFAKPDGVTVESEQIVEEKAEYGTNINFTITAQGMEITSVTYQVQGFDAKEPAYDNGTYTIPGTEIVAPITITITTNNVYTVTFEADENGRLDGSSSAVVVEGEKLNASQIPTPIGKTGFEFDGWYNDEDVKVDLLDEEINGNVTYKAVFVLATRTITVPEGVTLTDGENVVNTAQYGSPVQFTVAIEKGVVTKVYYTVGDGDTVELVAEDGVYTIAGNLITDDIEITVTEIKGADATVVEVAYDLSYASDFDMFILETEKLADKHYVFAGENAPSIFWSDKYNAYVAWVANGTKVESLVAGMSEADGAAEEILSGDVNGDGRITAADAGIINDCLHQQRTAPITHKQLFAMDIEGIKNEAGYQKVTTADITAILIEAVK